MVQAKKFELNNMSRIQVITPFMRGLVLEYHPLDK